MELYTHFSRFIFFLINLFSFLERSYLKFSFYITQVLKINIESPGQVWGLDPHGLVTTVHSAPSFIQPYCLVLESKKICTPQSHGCAISHFGQMHISWLLSWKWQCIGSLQQSSTVSFHWCATFNEHVAWFPCIIIPSSNKLLFTHIWALFILCFK